MTTFPTGVICDAARDLWGLEKVRGQIPAGPWKVSAGAPVLGPVHTLRVSRTLSPTGTALDDYFDAIDLVPAGAVVVVEAVGDVGGAIIGDAVATRLVTQGVVGLVVDGDVRDYQGILGTGISSWVRGARVDGVVMKEMLVEHGVEIRCGGVSVSPGDLIGGDADGVFVIPATEIDAVIEAAQALDAAEHEMFAQLGTGASLAHVYHTTGRA
jgi:regulator of RNase E activity RraA